MRNVQPPEHPSLPTPEPADELKCCSFRLPGSRSHKLKSDNAGLWREIIKSPVGEAATNLTRGALKTRRHPHLAVPLINHPGQEAP